MKKSFILNQFTTGMVIITALSLLFFIASIDWSFLEKIYTFLFQEIYVIENTLASLPH